MVEELKVFKELNEMRADISFYESAILELREGCGYMYGGYKACNKIELALVKDFMYVLALISLSPELDSGLEKDFVEIILPIKTSENKDVYDQIRPQICSAEDIGKFKFNMETLFEETKHESHTFEYVILLEKWVDLYSEYFTIRYEYVQNLKKIFKAKRDKYRECGDHTLSVKNSESRTFSEGLTVCVKN